MRCKTTALAVAMVCALTAFVTACGSDDDESAGSTPAASTPTASAEAGGASSEAKAFLEEHISPPSAITVTEPVGKPIPSGKTLVFLTCPVPACQITVPPLREAAKALGWEFKYINSGVTPQSIQDAFKQAIRLKPDAVAAVTGTPRDVFQDQLAELAKLNIPYVECCSTNQPGDGILASIYDKSTEDFIGKVMAAWIAVDSGGKANVALVHANEFANHTLIINSLVENLKTYCPDCTTQDEVVSAGDFGTKLPAKIVGLLRANPDLNYIAFGLDDQLLGVPAALQAAGLSDKVKIVGQAPGEPNLEEISNDGIEKASVSWPAPETMWHMADIIARHFVDADLEPSIAAAPINFLITKDTVGDIADDGSTIEGYQDQYKALWGLD